MIRVVLWSVAVLLFIGAAIAAVNFVGFGPGFPLVFLFVAVFFVGIVIYPLWRRREKDEAAQRGSADPSIPLTEQPDYRRPWDGQWPS